MGRADLAVYVSVVRSCRFLRSSEKLPDASGFSREQVVVVVFNGCCCWLLLFSFFFSLCVCVCVCVLFVCLFVLFLQT